MSQLKELHSTELKTEKDEVARLKAEIEQLREQHEIEITGMSKSFKDEIAKAKSDMEREKEDAVNETAVKFEEEVARLNKVNETERRLNKIQKEQVDLLNSKMAHWTTYTGKLNEDMAGSPLIL